ncbi:MAG: hypothetical protein AAFX46_00895 [Cyanobacteria bacterium J06636_27]
MLDDFRRVHKNTWSNCFIFFDALIVRKMTLLMQQIFEGDKLQHLETVRQKTKIYSIKVTVY